MADFVRTRHTVSGVIDLNTPIHIYNHVELGKYLELVGEDDKPFVPELHKPREAVKAKDTDKDES